MFSRLLILFLVVPILEIALLVQLGSYVGFWPTITLVILTAFLGSYFLKREGTAAWHRFFGKLHQGQLPGEELVDGLIIVVSGALLISPGVITDTLGLLGLFPPTRAFFRRLLLKRATRAVKAGTLRGGFTVFGRSPESAAQDERSGWGGTPVQTPGHSRDTPADPSRQTGF